MAVHGVSIAVPEPWCAQLQQLREDVAKVRTHPLIAGRVKVGGFLYDVDTGLLAEHV